MNILIVDDDSALLRSLEILLAGQGHHVVCFAEPYAACSFVEQDALRIDVLVVDYVLPGMGAEEILGRIRKHLPENCKVILITGHTDLISPLDIYFLKVDAFLPKPLDLDRLLDLVGDQKANAQ